MDTLCSQAFGANNKKGLGLILQRGSFAFVLLLLTTCEIACEVSSLTPRGPTLALLIELVLCIPIALVWIFAEPILLGLGQESEVAGKSSRVSLFL